MTGNFIDNIRYRWKSQGPLTDGYSYLETDFGTIRLFDTKENKPVILNVPDGPNVIEHQLPLIKELSKQYRVVCFEYPGMGFSYPNHKFDYSFKSGGNLAVQVMDILKIPKAALLFTCSNGFYAMQAASDFPDRFSHIFLGQTPSTAAMVNWTKSTIPGILKIPVIGQLSNASMAKKFAGVWYKYALPKNHPEFDSYVQTAQQSIGKGGCFCLSSLVQGLQKDIKTPITVANVPTTLIWGAKDYTHRNTDSASIKQHIKHCEIIEFEHCGHFPELEQMKSVVQLIKERVNK